MWNNQRVLLKNHSSLSNTNPCWIYFQGIINHLYAMIYVDTFLTVTRKITSLAFLVLLFFSGISLVWNLWSIQMSGGFIPVVERKTINRYRSFYVLHAFLLKRLSHCPHESFNMLNRMHQEPAWVFRFPKMYILGCHKYLLRDGEMLQMVHSLHFCFLFGFSTLWFFCNTN